MKKFIGMAMALSLPLLMLALAGQSARYFAIVSEMRRLEAVQSDWVEENRRLLSDIAIAKSRSRVGEAMSGMPGYHMVSPKTTLRIRVEPERGKRDG